VFCWFLQGAGDGHQLHVFYVCKNVGFSSWDPSPIMLFPAGICHLFVKNSVFVRFIGANTFC
jgi:hypothetical protein